MHSLGECGCNSKQTFSASGVEVHSLGERGCNSKQTFSASGVEVHSLGERGCNSKQTVSALGIKVHSLGEHGCNSKQTFSASGIEVHSLGERGCNSKQTFSASGVEVHSLGECGCNSKQTFSASGIEVHSLGERGCNSRQTFSALGIEVHSLGERGCNSKQTFSASGIEVHSLGECGCNSKQTFSALGVEVVPWRFFSKFLLGKADRGERTGRPAQEGFPKSSTGRPAQKGCPKASGLQYSDSTAVSSRDSIIQYIEAHGDELERANVKGSLARHADLWKTLTSDQLILGIIENGYQPPFLSTPPRFCKKHNTTATKNSDFVTHSVVELILNGFAKLTKKPCKVTNPFTVSIQSNGKKRLIADLRHLNNFLQTEKFKMEDWRTALPALRQ